MGISELLQIVGILIGVIVSFLAINITLHLNKIQKNNSNTIDRIEANREEENIESAAMQFLSDNGDEVEYLPYCIIADNINRYKKHDRKIYNQYMLCRDLVKERILEKAGVQFNINEDNSWVNRAINCAIDDIKEYGLTTNTDRLYDGAEYFHRAFTKYKSSDISEIDTEQKVFNHPCMMLRGMRASKDDNCGTFSEYFYDYIQSKARDEDNDSYQDMPYNAIPPIDYLSRVYNFEHCDERIICFWTMEILSELVANIKVIRNRDTQKNNDLDNLSDTFSEKFEDRYYEVLYLLYCTYIMDENHETDTKTL